MSALFKLINRYYWNGFFGPFFTIFFPVIIFFFMGNVAYSSTLGQLKNSGASEEVISSTMISLGKGIIAGILISSIISNGLIGFPTTILEFKKSTLIKRIGSANVKKSHFMVTSLLYQLAWTIFSILWVPFIGCMVLGFNKYMNWSIGFNLGLISIIPYMLVLFLVSISMGLLIISLVQSHVAASAVTNLVYFPISFLSGGFGTGKPNLEYAPAINYFSYILPTKYATDPAFRLFELNGKYSLLYSEIGWQSWGFPLIATIVSLIFLLVSIKLFKWGE